MWMDAVWSMYEYVKPRLLSYVTNPANNAEKIKAISEIQVAGVFNAQDWPPKQIKFNTFYLLTLDDAPIGKQGYSQYSPMLFHQVQWTWVVKGTDLTQGIRQANRGDRWVITETMKGALLSALSPGYTTKLTWALNNAGVFVGSPTSTPNEPITWPPVSFHTRFDKASGIQYIAAPIRIWDMTDAIVS
jgi:hypothetical protein